MSRYPNAFPFHDKNPSQTYVGTGDIEPPKDRLNPKPDPNALAITPQPIYGQSWAEVDEQVEKASKEKREKLAEALAKGELRTQGQLKKMAEALGCSIEEVKRRKMTPTVKRLVQERLETHALYATAEALPSQAALAHEDVASFKAIAQVAKVLQAAGINVQTNIAVDQRNGGDNLGDREWFRAHWNRANANLALVEDTKVDPEPQPPPEDEPEPESV